MIILEGKGVYGGYAFGAIAVYRRNSSVVKRGHIEDAETETARFRAARDTAVQQLKQLYHKAL